MSRLLRPYIPLAVRVQVARRQCVAAKSFINVFGVATDIEPVWAFALPHRDTLNRLLVILFGEKKPELHHRPALVNRHRKRNGDYDPPANDPNYLVYLVDDDHDVETRIRGLHGQHSDLGLARKNKRIARNRDPKRRKAKIAQRKHPWPKGRKLRNRPMTAKNL